MTIEVEALACATCGSYVHPFLEACPACGTPRDGRYADATDRPDLGIRELLVDPRFAGNVRQVVLRYSLKMNAAAPTSEVHEGLAVVAGSLPYRVRGAGAADAVASDQAYFELTPSELVIRERNPSREVVRIALATILATGHAPRDRAGGGAWAGLAFDGRVDHAAPLLVDGALVITSATPAVGRVALANPGGLLTPKARPDHYGIVAAWLGLVAAGATEARWCDVGVRRHAAELGLAAMPSDAGAGAVPGSGPGEGRAAPATAAGGSGVRRALEELEDLRTAGLVTADEYAAKRREILDRL